MSNSALLVIDFINDIVHPQGKIAAAANFVQQHRTIEKANEAIRHARLQNYLVIFVKVGFSANYVECPAQSPLFSKVKEVGALQLNTWGTEFHSDLDVKANDLIIAKHRVSAFYATSLAAILSAQNIETLYLSGVSSNMTITSTAREAHDRDFRVSIIKDACGTSDEELHENSMNLLSRVASIISTEQFCNKNYSGSR